MPIVSTFFLFENIYGRREKRARNTRNVRFAYIFYGMLTQAAHSGITLFKMRQLFLTTCAIDSLSYIVT